MIVLLTGGSGSERTVSLATAKTISASLTRLSEPFCEIDVAEVSWLAAVLELKPKMAIIAVHGTFGEDGGLQHVLENADIPHTGCSAEVAKITFDKRATKKCVGLLGIKVADEYSLRDRITNFPIVVKPNSEGSSIGITIVHDVNELDEALHNAQQYGDVLLEEYVSGREFTCAVCNLFGKVQALPLVEIKPTHEFFDYESKYAIGGSEEICPASLDEETTKKIMEQSENIFRSLNIGQYCRIDWILSQDIPYFLEVNTIPGMTSTSLINKEIVAADISFDDFIAQLIATI